MADDKSKRVPQDSSKINLSEDYELRYWAGRFGVTPEQIKAAVAKAGNNPEAVAKELKYRG